MIPKRRPQFRNVSIVAMLPYVARFPASAWVSLLHRVSGGLMYFLLPAIIWAFDESISTEISFARMTAVFERGYAFMPGWFMKVVVLALVWAFLHHMIAALRFLMLDLNHGAADKVRAARSARWVLVISVAMTIALGAKIFG